MNELMIVANVAIVFGVVYKLFELFVCRKERMMLIEKLGDKLPPEQMKSGISYSPVSFSFGGLRLGCLLLGVGIGLIAAFLLIDTFGREDDYVISTAYGACVLIGGGFGLIASYVVELVQLRKK